VLAAVAAAVASPGGPKRSSCGAVKKSSVVAMVSRSGDSRNGDNHDEDADGVVSLATLANLEKLAPKELKGMIIELMKENHGLKNRLNRTEKKMEGLSGKPKGSGDYHGHPAEERLAEQQLQMASLLECLQDHEKVVDLQEREISAMLCQLPSNQGHMEELLHRLIAVQQRVHTTRHRTDDLIEQMHTSAKCANSNPDMPRSVRTGVVRPSEALLLRPAPPRPPGPSRPAAAAGTSRARKPDVLHLVVLIMPGAVVRTTSKVALDVLCTESSDEVKQRLAEAGVLWGSREEQDSESVMKARLLFRGMTLASGIPLTSYGVADGSVLRLLPALGRERLRCSIDGEMWHRDVVGGTAARGVLMNPSTRPYSAKSRNDTMRPEELVPDSHTTKALLAAHDMHRSLFGT